LNFSSRQPRLSILCIEQLAVYLMYTIGLRHYRGEAALTMHELAEALKLPWESVGEILGILVRRHLLAISTENDGSYQLLRDTDGIPLKDILLAVRREGEVIDLGSSLAPDAAAALLRLRDSLDQGYDQCLKNLTLRDLILDRQQPPTMN